MLILLQPVYAPFVRSDETQCGWAFERELQDGTLERSGIFSVNQSGLLAQRRDHAVDKLFMRRRVLRPPPTPRLEIIISEHIEVCLAGYGMNLVVTVGEIAFDCCSIIFSLRHVVMPSCVETYPKSK